MTEQLICPHFILCPSTEELINFWTGQLSHHLYMETFLIPTYKNTMREICYVSVVLLLT